MKDIISNTDLVAYCGLYCGACSRYLKDSCPGCHANEKATWCKVRSCCMEHHYSSCAECTEFGDARACKKFNNPISKVIGFVLRSDRPACITQIKSLGIQGHADTMTKQKIHAIKR